MHKEIPKGGGLWTSVEREIWKSLEVTISPTRTTLSATRIPRANLLLLIHRGGLEVALGREAGETAEHISIARLGHCEADVGRRLLLA
jgi:hypothetical protein